MANITVLHAKENSKSRRYKKQGEFLARKIARKEVQKSSRSVEEIIDSIIKPECPFETMARVVIELSKLPTAPDTRKQPRLRKPIMSDGSVTARG
ncbi:hypothetical protein ABVE29_003695 [Providencia stuartii]